MDDNGYGQPNGPGSDPGGSHWLRSHASQPSNTQIPTFARPGSDRNGALGSFEYSSSSKAAFDGANSIDESQQAALDNPFNVPAGYRTTVARATGVAAEQHTDKASRGRQGHENAAQELYMKQPRRSKRGSPRGQVRTRPFWLFQNLVTKGADMSVFALCHSFQHVSCYRPTARIPVQSLSGCPERSVRSRAQGGDDVGRRW